MMLAIFASLMSLGLQSFPAGSVICLERQGGIALECTERVCCDSMAGTDGQGQPDPVHAGPGVISCTHCIDVYLPHDHFAMAQHPSVMVPMHVADAMLIAVIDWPQPRVVTPAGLFVDRQSPHLVQIASTVIRC